MRLSWLYYDNIKQNFNLKCFFYIVCLDMVVQPLYDIYKVVYVAPLFEKKNVYMYVYIKLVS